MNYATIKYCDIANGEGVRTSLFVSGCRRHCPNCFNAVAWDFNYGAPFTDAVKEQIIESLAPGYINGLSLLGGEPLEPENQRAAAALYQRGKRPAARVRPSGATPATISNTRYGSPAAAAARSRTSSYNI